MSVSIVIPAYNRAARLPTAIDSVQSQGIAGLEIVIVDDGSVDNTREVLTRYGSAIKYIYQSNAGVGAARNTGIRHATREFVAFLDSDDRWHDFKLDAQLALFRARPDVGLVFSDFVIEKPDGSVQTDGASRWANRPLDFPGMTRLRIRQSADSKSVRWPVDAMECYAGDMYRQLLDELPILTSSVIVRRSVLDATTWYAESVALFEDWEFFARMARRAAVGYIGVSTAVNVGHDDPGRVSRCSALDRARSYQSLLERVWLADTEFVDSHREAVRSAYGRALLAVAREALLAGRADLATAALQSWRAAGYQERRAWAAVYSVCALLPAGRTLLKQVLRGCTAARLIIGARRSIVTVNPAA